MQTLERYLSQLRWPRVYMLVALAILLGSSLYWSWLGAQVQQGNADQLVNGYLFENSHTFAGAFFPSTHTQLLKWPMFALLRYADFSPTAYIISTMFLVVITVAAFSYLLYRIDHRPLYFGTTCTLLACVLASIPVQVFDTVTTPLNMAMLTGRNIEYIVYIAAIALVLKAPRFKSSQFLSATLLLTLLLVSDQMFVILSLGGSGLLLAAAWLITNRPLKAVVIRWLASSGIACLAAILLQWAVNHSVTHIVSASSSYTTLTWTNLMISLPRTINALALNFGISRQGGSISALVNLAIAIVMTGSAIWLINKLRKHPHLPLEEAPALAVMLLASSIVAVAVYVVTAQSYLGDARYLTITLFAGFVVFATYLRTKRLTAPVALLIGFFAALAMLTGLFNLIANTNKQLANDQLQKRNHVIASTLSKHHVEYLVGNYWRVFPIKAISREVEQKVVPLDSCTRPAQLLGSQAWRPDLRVHSFAYILTLRSVAAAAPSCTRQLVTFRFGRPTATTIISGSPHNPAELLLFYDDGTAAQSAP